MSNFIPFILLIIMYYRQIVLPQAKYIGASQVVLVIKNLPVSSGDANVGLPNCLMYFD